MVGIELEMGGWMSWLLISPFICILVYLLIQAGKAIWELRLIEYETLDVITKGDSRASKVVIDRIKLDARLGHFTAKKYLRWLKKQGRA